MKLIKDSQNRYILIMKKDEMVMETFKKAFEEIQKKR
jgi:hypothetical protein